MAVHPLLLAFGVGLVGLSAGPVEVQIGIEVLLVEALDAPRVRRRDVRISHVFADHRAVFRFHQAVVVGVPRTRLGLFVSSLFNSFSTVRLRNSLPLSEWKPRIRKGNCSIMAFSNGSSQASLIAGDHLPLGDFIHGIDVVDALDAIAIPLMHRIHSQKAGLAFAARRSTPPWAGSW